jgi:cytochrome c553
VQSLVPSFPRIGVSILLLAGYDILSRNRASRWERGGDVLGSAMRWLFFAVMLLSAPPSIRAETLDWAYPPAPKAEPLDNVIMKQMPGSTKKYTQAQIDAFFDPPDWYSGEHPPMPPVVAHGVKPAVQACSRCHLPSGNGHPESSSLAGLPVAYFIRQMAAFKNEERKGVRAANMIAFAKALRDEDAVAAANYYAALQPGIWTKVIETGMVPMSYIGPGAMRFAMEGGAMEPIGNRIIVLPQDKQRAESRDSHSGFIDYVPIGSLQRGEALVTKSSGGKTIPCAICHGPNLKGLAEIPSIAGRPPIYVFRQLYDMQQGRRIGTQVELMKAVVANLTETDMIAIAAYLGSRDP